MRRGSDIRKPLKAALALTAAGICGFGAYAWHPTIAAVEPPPRSSFDPALVRRGEVLAAIGNCTMCHTEPGRPSFSGGVPIATPFGTVYSSNVTPDPDTGVGRWSEAAFTRAMHEGLDREGRHLYPAFPYDHFTHVSDEDDRALYAYLMTRDPARFRPPENDLMFPLNFRPVVAGWKLLFFRPGPVDAGPGYDEAWRRGAYLVEGLGHCGACHSPRNMLGAEKGGDAHLAGGMAEGWNAYALNAASPAPVRWSIEAMATYLRHGFEASHGVSRGPMAPVTANLASLSDADARAMAVYLTSLMGQREEDRPKQPDDKTAPATQSYGMAGSQVAVSGGGGEGATIYGGACASCHESGRLPPWGGLALALSSALHAPDPSNIVTVTLHGLAAPPGEGGAVMPGFDGTLTDDQLVQLLAYLRSGLAHEPPWPDLARTVSEVRTRAVTLYASDGTSTAPAETQLRVTP